MSLEVKITSAVKQAIEQLALATRPFECCGLLSGKGDVITTTHPLRNEAEKAETRYFAAPEDLFAAMKRIREKGEEMIGIYHSHPRSSAYPSASDVEMAFYPEAIYFIISLEPEMELRAFRITDAYTREVQIVIIENV